jgi:hypothetical protein
MRTESREVSETVAAATVGPRRLTTATPEEDDRPAGRPPAAQEDELADRLLALPRAEGRMAVTSDPRYHRLGLARRFVMAAETALLADRPADAEPAAELAVAIAMELPNDGEGEVHRTAALGQWLLGKALLRGHCWARAARALEVMYAHIPDQAPSAERGLAAYGLAQLYADVESLDMATGMATLAARQFSLLGTTEPATAACHAQAGLLLQESGDLEAAAIQLMLALRVLLKDPGLAPSLCARLLLALACVEATLGRDDDARRRLRSARHLYRLAPSRGESVERDWREALAMAAAGRAAAAERRLDRVRRQLLKAGSLAEAARATVDHAELRIGAGRIKGVKELVAALAGVFPGEGETWAQEIAGLARLAGAGRASERYLARQELRVSLRLEAPATPGRPELITPWRSLTDRLVRGHAESPEASGGLGGV